MTTKNYIKIYSPATIANMGPGFDCLGGAIDIWNEFEFLLQPEIVNSLIILSTVFKSFVFSPSSTIIVLYSKSKKLELVSKLTYIC